MKIPTHVVRRAVADARESPLEEVGGFFVFRPTHEQGTGGETTYEHEWMMSPNCSAHPERAYEMDARWIVELILDKGWTPLGFFHSHPAGDPRPSTQTGGDYDSFPQHYVKNAFIWGHAMPDKLVRYSQDPGFFQFLLLREVYADV